MRVGRGTPCAMALDHRRGDGKRSKWPAVLPSLAMCWLLTVSLAATLTAGAWPNSGSGKSWIASTPYDDDGHLAVAASMPNVRSASGKPIASAEAPPYLPIYDQSDMDEKDDINPMAGISQSGANPADDYYLQQGQAGHGSSADQQLEQPYAAAGQDDDAPAGSFSAAFLTCFAMIFFSEIGDKTFLIAAIMSMRHSRMVTFLGALLALALMTLLSAVCGQFLPSLIPRQITLGITSGLFFLFGIKMIRDGMRMTAHQVKEEYEEVSHQILECEETEHHQISMARRQSECAKMAPRKDGDAARPSPLASSPPSYSQLERGMTQPGASPASLSCCQRAWCCVKAWALSAGSAVLKLFDAVIHPSGSKAGSSAFLQTFSLTFLAEWGDRSQLATIALAANQHFYGTILGGICGHAVCTALAVLCGRLLGTVMSIKTGTAWQGDASILASM